MQVLVITISLLLVAGTYATTGLRGNAGESFFEAEVNRLVDSQADEAHRAMAGSGEGLSGLGACDRIGNQMGKNITCKCTSSMQYLTFSCTSQKRTLNPTWAGNIDYSIRLSNSPVKGTNTLKVPSTTLYAQGQTFSNYSMPEFNFASKFTQQRGGTVKLDSCTASYTNGTTTKSCLCQPCGSLMTIDCTMIDFIPQQVRDLFQVTCVQYTPVSQIHNNYGAFIPGWYGWK